MKLFPIIIAITLFGISSCEKHPEEHRAIRLISFRGETSDHFFGMGCNSIENDSMMTVWASGLLPGRTYDSWVGFDFADHSQMSGPMLNAYIVADAENHQVFYRISEGLDMTITYDDTDGHGNPLGIRTRLTTGQPSSGQLTITLIHSPNKFADVVSDGDITNAGGTVDFECTFDVEIH